MKVQTLGIAVGLALICATARGQAVEYISARRPYVTKEADPQHPKALNVDYGLPVYFECPTDAFVIVGRAVINGPPLMTRAEREWALRSVAKGARAQRAEALWLQSPRVGNSVEAFAIRWAR